MGRIRIGLSGWEYDAWRGDFYPDGLPRSRQLEFAAGRFDTLEVNGTFYGLTTASACRRWYEAAPPGFVFAVKGSRYITHIKKLSGVETALANFFASGLLDLGEKLGPILWQLPPNLRFDAGRLEDFLELLPRDTDRASLLAHSHDERVADVSYGHGPSHRMRHVLEVRHPSHLCAESIRIVRRHGVALAFSHSSAWPYTEEITAGFVYIRLHGPERLYASAYGEDRLAQWANRIRTWHDGDEPHDASRVTTRRPPSRRSRDVYVYFDNDAQGHAPREAQRLKELLGDG